MPATLDDLLTILQAIDAKLAAANTIHNANKKLLLDNQRDAVVLRRLAYSPTVIPSQLTSRGDWISAEANAEANGIQPDVQPPPPP